MNVYYRSKLNNTRDVELIRERLDNKYYEKNDSGESRLPIELQRPMVSKVMRSRVAGRTSLMKSVAHGN